MAQLRQWLSQKASKRLLGLIAIGMVGIGLMMSCNEDNSSKPTVSNIPMFPEGQSSENSEDMGFYSSSGDGQFGAWAGDIAEFLISVPAGDYLLTYSSTVGTFYVAFRATNAAVLHIGLIGNDRVSSASIEKGAITNTSLSKWESQGVALFAWPGSGAAWNSVFQGNGAVIVMISGGQAASGVYKLPAPSWAPVTVTTSTTTSDSTTTSTSESTTTTTSDSTTTTSTSESTTTTTSDSTTTTSTSESTTTTTTTSTTQVDFSGSASAGESYTWNINPANTAAPLSLVEECGTYVQNNTSSSLDVTFTSNAQEMTTAVAGGDTVFSGDFVGTVCSVTWRTTRNEQTIGGTSNNNNITTWDIWEISGFLEANQIMDCNVAVNNTGSAEITVMFSGGSDPDTRTIPAGESDSNYGDSTISGQCPVSWSLVP